MGSSDGWSKDIQPCAFDELNRLPGIGQLGLILGDFDLVFHAADGTQFPFNRYVTNLVTVVDNFLGLADVLLIRLLGSIDHDIGITAIRTLLAMINLGAMIQV